MDWNTQSSEVQYVPFMILDLALGVNVHKNLNMQLQVRNATDENYYEKLGFNLPGRNLRAKVTYRF